MSLRHILRLVSRDLDRFRTDFSISHVLVHLFKRATSAESNTVACEECGFRPVERHTFGLYSASIKGPSLIICRKR